jgi:type IV secretory pathway TrbD component
MNMRMIGEDRGKIPSFFVVDVKMSLCYWFGFQISIALTQSMASLWKWYILNREDREKSTAFLVVGILFYFYHFGFQSWIALTQIVPWLWKLYVLNQGRTEKNPLLYFVVDIHIQYRSNVLEHLLIQGVFFMFYCFLHCRIIVKTTKLWNNTYGIM